MCCVVREREQDGRADEWTRQGGGCRDWRGVGFVLHEVRLRECRALGRWTLRMPCHGFFWPWCGGGEIQCVYLCFDAAPFFEPTESVVHLD